MSTVSGPGASLFSSSCGRGKGKEGRRKRWVPAAVLLSTRAHVHNARVSCTCCAASFTPGCHALQLPRLRENHGHIGGPHGEPGRHEGALLVAQRIKDVSGHQAELRRGRASKGARVGQAAEAAGAAAASAPTSAALCHSVAVRRPRQSEQRARATRLPPCPALGCGTHRQRCRHRVAAIPGKDLRWEKFKCKFPSSCFAIVIDMRVDLTPGSTEARCSKVGSGAGVAATAAKAHPQAGQQRKRHPSIVLKVVRHKAVAAGRGGAGPVREGRVHSAQAGKAHCRLSCYNFIACREAEITSFRLLLCGAIDDVCEQAPRSRKRDMYGAEQSAMFASPPETAAAETESHSRAKQALDTFV